MEPIAFNQKLGGNIRRRRRELKLTQAQLGKRIHCAASKISRIETGESELRAWEVYMICEALDCTIADLWPVSTEDFPLEADLKEANDDLIRIIGAAQENLQNLQILKGKLAESANSTPSPCGKIEQSRSTR